MSADIERLLIRDFELLDEGSTVAEAHERLMGHPPGRRYGIVVDETGALLTCVTAGILGRWYGHRTLKQVRDEWPPLCLVVEDEATNLQDVAHRFRDDLLGHDYLPGVVLVDGAGRRPRAILPRHQLLAAVGPVWRSSWEYPDGCGGPESPPPPPSPEPDGCSPFRLFAQLFGGSMGQSSGYSSPGRRYGVIRYGRLQLPAQAPLGQRCKLVVTVNREEVAGAPGQARLGLAADPWPLKVVASVRVRPDEFVIEGPSRGVIAVQEHWDSAPVTFSLIPQSPGPKTIRVKFEQNNTYLNTAWIHTQVVAADAVPGGRAPVEGVPSLNVRTLPPDLTIHVEQRG
jgi:hypothetical protein